MWHLSGHVAEKFNSLFTLFSRMNVCFVFLNSSNSDEISHLNWKLIKFFFIVVTMSHILFKKDYIRRGLLTGDYFRQVFVAKYQHQHWNVWHWLLALLSRPVPLFTVFCRLLFFWFQSYNIAPVPLFISVVSHVSHPPYPPAGAAVPVAAVMKCSVTIFERKSLLSLRVPVQPPLWQRAVSRNQLTWQ